MTGRIAGFVAAVLVLVSPAAAQELEFNGELRPRFEIRDPVGLTGTVEFTSMRTRVSLEAALDGDVTAFVQLQDVRVFGEEESTLADYSADGLDLHQGWVELGDASADQLSLRVGRQQAAYGGQRLVGAVNWTQQGRAFDGARVRYRLEPGVVVDGVAFRLANSVVSPGVADAGLYGVYSTVEAAGALDLFALLHTSEATLTERDVYTLGTRWVSENGPWSWRVEGAYQSGRSDVVAVERDIAAFMLGGRVGTRVSEDLGVTLWYDYLSGDDDPGDDVIRVFDTLFATNHKFYGYMDFFLNIPVHTAARGLQDVALKGTYDVREGHTLRADLHTFSVTATDGLDTGHIGEELDLTYQWAYTDAVSVTTGLSYFLRGGDPPAGVNVPGDNQLWGYVMLDVVF